MKSNEFFPQIERTSSARKRGESAFTFLTRLDSPQADLLRSRIESWLQSAPDTFKQRSLEGLTSEDDRKHDAAIFELFLHQFLLDSGLPILEYEPIVAGSRPDFIIEWPDKRRVAIEATTIERTPRKEAGDEDFRNQIWQALQELPRSSRLFHLSFEGAFHSQPRTKMVAQSIQRQIDSYPSKAQYTCAERGALIIVTEVAQRENGRTGQAFGIASIGRSGFIYPQGRLRDKIRRKYPQIRKFQGPTIIAISCPAIEFGLDVLTAALFGDDEFSFNADFSTTLEATRAANGILIHHGSPELTNLSGLLAFDQNYTLGFSEIAPIFFENPWAKRKLDGSALPVTRLNPNSEMSVMIETTHQSHP